MGSAYGAGAGADMLQNVLRDLFDRQFRQKEMKLREDDLGMRRQDRADALDLRRRQIETTEESNKSLREQRETSADLHRQQTADRLAKQLQPGDVLDANASGTLRGGRLGSLIDHQASVLPSTAIAGAVQQTQRAPRILGLARTMHEGHGERDVFRGTVEQQQGAQERSRLMAIANDPNTPDNIRQYINLSDAMPGRGSLPSTLFQSDEQPVYQLGADGVLRSVGNVPRGARVTNAPRPPRPRETGPTRTQRELPPSPQAYALDIARKHGGNWDGALEEIGRYFRNPQTRIDHPDMSLQRFTAFVKSAMARPGGSGGDDDLIREVTRGGASSSGGRGAVAGSASASSGGGASPDGKSVTTAELQALAEARGTSVAAERQRAEAAGYAIR